MGMVHIKIQACILCSVAPLTCCCILKSMVFWNVTAYKEYYILEYNAV
jgi:hypothetical protein